MNHYRRLFSQTFAPFFQPHPTTAATTTALWMMIFGHNRDALCSQTMENACVREIRQVNPDIVILRDAAWVQVLRSLGYRTYGHIHYRADKFAVFTIKDQSTDAGVVTNDSKGGAPPAPATAMVVAA